jgi:osmotically-inducible protein OsmY
MSSSLSLSRRQDHDRSLRAHICKVLEETGYTALRRVDCRVYDGVVELSGDVPTFYFKQIAQSAVLSIQWVRGVRNRLEVR